ncbi:Forkhead transcription factor [Conoideocrella luteorostrata]|uniref:Forkhead transcription factor n=1 Tax=Conoideocrella luteorostrata TaxID=1105319 RepID=A0AAJ0CJU7_9HYPO|nr:Forkhead transcription factor [Conoideocrella luteorostrata]
MARATPFSGPNEPLHIFQDDVIDRSAPMTSHAPMPSVTKPARRPLSSSNSNVILNAPTGSNAGLSPHKAKSSSPRSPLKASSHGNKLNIVSMAPPTGKGPTTDSLQKKPHLSKFKTGPQRPSFDIMNYGKENMHPQIFPAPATINMSVESYYQKPNGKRILMDAPQITDSRPAKKSKTEEPALPPHDSFPPITDDGAKPPHSYAQLIGMSILRSPVRRLTLAQIYKWISDNYSFYSPTDAGWQNSIRHNLSLHKNFIKIERPKDDPGKGNYWGIEPGTEYQFLKEKPTRKAAPTAENLPVMSTRLEPSRPMTAPMQEPTLPQPNIMHYATLPPLPTSQVALSMPAEVSSDATIPVSDNIGPEDSGDKSAENDLPIESMYSPLPANMHSSPPMSRHVETRSGTPPPTARNPASSVSRSHKRKFASMDDSGYISSLESSVMRPNQKAMLLTSEADRPRIKRGRAEEEIARLRNSSPFSPTKSRSLAYGLISSSPLRQANENQTLPPLTPVIKLKPPVRPPPSASPNTNLRIHRDKVRHMLQSPLRRVTGITEDNMPWSPAFNLDDAVYTFDDMGMASTDFDIFQDFPAMEDSIFPGIGSIDAGSPIKRSAKRARLDRSVSTSALGEVNNSVTKKPFTSMPLFKISENSPSRFFDTPSKAFEGLGSPSKLFQRSPSRLASPSKFSAMLDLPVDADWPSLGMDPTDFGSHSNPSASDFTGLDILQGFEKIGSGSQTSKQQQPRGSKPPLGRSFSTTF